MLAGSPGGKPGIPRPRCLPLTFMLLVAAGCQGQIEDPESRPFQAGVGPTGFGPAGVAQNQQPGSANVAQLTDDPELQVAALRYFPNAAAASGGHARLFRLTRTQLDATTQSLLPKLYKTTALSVLPRDPLQTNYEYADILSFNQANFTPYVAWVDELATAARANPSSVITCSDMSDRACLQTQAQGFVNKAFRGLATPTQLEKFSSFFVTEVAQLGLTDAVADLVSLTLTSPGYVFRDEVPREGARLSAAQRLQNITYALADSSPEALNLASADAATFVGTPDAQARTIDSVLKSALARQKLVRFFTAWLEVREPAEFTIDPSVFPLFTPSFASAAIADTQAFLQKKLVGDAPSLRSITQADDAIVSDALAQVYGVSKGSAQLQKLDPMQRLGIFTQPAVIASHSGPTTTRLIKRGVFFTRKVMCLPLGLPPVGVNTTLPEAPSKTERERVEQATQAATCQGCHSMINPFGFMQENYDAIGRYRTRDNNQPVDAHIELKVLDEGPLNTASPIEAFTTITNSRMFEQCFTRQLFRFYLGREEMPEDNAALREMFISFADKDHQDILRMLRSLALSTTFSQRTEAP
ncbi:MAG TPA: DUF1588 domain-containing protein [Polyangiales bacterium]|nr:DUF1588 domain-containing protein [Polyangiales bacterium]